MDKKLVPGTGSIRTATLLKKQILWSQPKSSESEFLGWQPGICV